MSRRLFRVWVAVFALCACLFGARSDAMVGGVTLTGFVAGGDLSGSAFVQTVVGLQGHAVASTAPLGGQVIAWSNVDSDWEPTTISSSPTGPWNAAEASAAYAAGGIAQGLATSVANLCVGPTFHVSSSNISCSGADFYWRNGGSVAHLLKATLWDMSTASSVASGTLSVTADGRYQIPWSSVALVGGRYYWLTVGPNDGSSIFGWVVLPANTTLPQWYGLMFVETSGNYTTTNTAVVASNYSQFSAVWPILTGS